MVVQILGFILESEGIAVVAKLEWQQIETSNREIKMFPLRQPPDKILMFQHLFRPNLCAWISHLIRWMHLQSDFANRAARSAS